MDEIVKAALKKWPNVPACYDWLALDARGDWYMRDERIQAAGPFPAVKGSRITHDKLKEFIHRNYAADEHGAWFFQNGPQRVYVELEAAPLVFGLERLPAGGSEAKALGGAPEGHPAGGDGSMAAAPRLRAHTGHEAGPVRGAWLDEHGRVFLDTPQGLGLVHSLDMAVAADAIEAGLWPLHETRFAELPARFGFCLRPRPPG